MKVVLTTNDLGELHFEGEPKEVFEDLKRAFIQMYPKSIDDSVIKDKAEKWDKLGEKIATFYTFDEEGNELEDEGGDLCDIGEAAASAFGWL